MLRVYEAYRLDFELFDYDFNEVLTLAGYEPLPWKNFTNTYLGMDFHGKILFIFQVCDTWKINVKRLWWNKFFRNEIQQRLTRTKTMLEQLHAVEKNSIFEIAALFYQVYGEGKSTAISKLDFYILSETRMLRNDYFMFFFKTVVCKSPSKTGFSLWQVKRNE